VEKAWAAARAVMRDDTEWVSIDEVGDFLAKRQIDATARKFSPQDMNSRYALKPGLSKHPKGWEPHLVAAALSEAVDKRLVEHERRESGNFFRALPSEDHQLWGLQNEQVPRDPTWKL
jgi:hypothetical protein